MLGNEKMVAVIDYDTIKSLLQNADGKVRGAVVGNAEQVLKHSQAFNQCLDFI